MKRNRLSKIVLMMLAVVVLAATAAFTSSAAYEIRNNSWQYMQARTYYSFVPSFTGFYVFESDDNTDPVGVIYDENMNRICGADDVNGREFEMKAFLEKGKTYYFYAYEYGQSSTDYRVYVYVNLTDELEKLELDKWQIASGLFKHYFIPEKSGYYIFESAEGYSASGKISDSSNNILNITDTVQGPFSLEAYLQEGEVYLFWASYKNDTYEPIDVRLTMESTDVNLGQWQEFRNGSEYEFVPSESGYYIFESDDGDCPATEIYEDDEDFASFDEYDYYYHDDYDFELRFYLTAGKTYRFFVYSDYNNKIKVRLGKECTHNDVTSYSGQAATCIAEGYTESKFCNDCESWLVEKTTISKDSTNHINTENSGAVEATCTVAGSSGIVACKDCGATVRENEIIYPAHADFNADGKCDKCRDKMLETAVPKDIDLVQLAYEPFEFDGTTKTPDMTVLYGNTVLEYCYEYEYEDFEGGCYYIEDSWGNYQATSQAQMELEISPEGFANFSETFTYTILKKDISKATVTIKGDTRFYGAPVTPQVKVTLDDKELTLGTDFEVDYLDNCSVGEGIVRVVGIGNYKGYVDTVIDIVRGDTSDMAQLDPILDASDLNYSNNNISAGCGKTPSPAYSGVVNSYVTFGYDTSCSHRVSSWTCEIRYGGDLVTRQSLSSTSKVQMKLLYEGVYDITISCTEDQGHTCSGYKYDPYTGTTRYTTWWESEYETIEKSFSIYVASTKPLPKPKTLEGYTVAEETKNIFIAVGTNDSNLVNFDVDEWKSSDSTVATVKDGMVTFLRPGTVNITAKVGSVSAKWSFTRQAIKLDEKAEIVNFSKNENKVTVVCDGELLTSEDYETFIQQKGRLIIVTVRGKGLYSGSISRAFMIENSLPFYCSHSYTTTETEATCTSPGTRIYTCKTCTAREVVILTEAGHKYSDSFSVDKKATTTANGLKSRHCTVKGCTGRTEETVIYKVTGFALSAAEFTYNGKSQTPSVTVKDSKGNKLSNDKDYTVSYESGRKNPGKYTVKITLKGKYSGSKSLYFTIAPKKVGKITFGTIKADSFKIAWSKVTGADGYVVYLKNNRTGKYEKYKTLSGGSSVKCTVKGLKSGTGYTVKVKAYKKDDGTIWGVASDAYTYYTAPMTPRLSVTSKNGKAVASWTNVAGESGYQLQYSASNSTGFKDVNKYSVNTTKGTKSGLRKGKTYYFRVRAYKKVGSKVIYSSWSTVRSVKIK